MSAASTSTSTSTRVRRRLADAAGRTTARLARRVGYRGTSLPGMVAERIDPGIVRRLRAELGTVVVVLGSNGKTTTTHLIARILERADGRAPISNRSGANLRQGVIAAMLAPRPGQLAVTAAPAAGAESPQTPPGRRRAVFEVDELAFGGLIADLRPDVVVVLNLLRDQIDRYGEIDMIADRWADDFARLRRDTVLVACADDPRIEGIVRRARRPVRRFGLDPATAEAVGGAAAGARPAAPAGSAAAGATSEQYDAPRCPDCHETIAFRASTGVGLGDWACSSCGLERAVPDLAAGIDGIEDDGQLRLRIAGTAPEPEGIHRIRVHLTGTAAAYDTAAALLAAESLGIPIAAGAEALEGATPAFGRLEEVAIRGRRVVLSLSKNPASFDQAAQAIRMRRPDGLLIGLSDRPADGRDVSWIWDVDFGWADAAPFVGVTGTRADDLVLRLKYGTGATEGHADPAVVEPDVERALDAALDGVPLGGALMIVATYTAMLGLRRVLEHWGAVAAVPT